MFQQAQQQLAVFYARPLAWSCPDIICDPVHASGPKNVPKTNGGLPSIGGAIGDALKSVVQFFTGSPKQNLQWLIQAVTTTPVADLGSDAFIQVYRRMWGLLTIISVLGAALSFIAIIVRNSRTDSVYRPYKQLLKIYLVGWTLPAGVTAVILAGGGFSNVCLDLFGKIKWPDFGHKWPTFSESVGDMIMSVIAMCFKVVITTEIVPINLSVFLLTMVALLAYSLTTLKNGVIGGFTRTMWALLITALITQPLMVLTLTLGSSMVPSYASSSAAQSASITGLFVLTFIMPLLVFVGAKKRVDTVVRNHALRVEGEVDANTKIAPSAQQRDTARIVNSQIATIAGATPASAAREHRLVRDGLLVGAGAGAEHIIMSGANRLAARGSPLLGTAVAHVYGRHVKGKWVSKTLPGQSRTYGVTPLQSPPPEKPEGGDS